MKIKIIIATHKKYWMPIDEIYMPLHVGKEGKESLGYAGDNTGTNISIKNSNYCELTAVYWAWKNLNADYIGLVHYRRHFTNEGYLMRLIKGKKKCVLNSNDALKLLKQYDAVVPKRRNYYIETNRSHYNHAHYSKDLDIVESIINEKYPDYSEAFSLVMNRTWAHMFNMFIMKKEYFDEYCEWLFSILEELESKIDISKYDLYNKRVFGFVSERLLDVWIEAKKIRYKEVPVMFMEKEHWLKKGTAFLIRKFRGNLTA